MHAEFYSLRPRASQREWYRRAHRAIATLFLLTVAANFLAMIAGPPPWWITYAPLPPLFLLMASGTAMLVRPRWKKGRP